MTNQWEQLEIPGIPGVTESFRNTPARPEYGQISGPDFAGERGEDVTKINNGVDGEDPYAALFRYWQENPGELRKALLDPDSPPTRFERDAAKRLRERLGQAGDPQ
jgi:hypothetical protein